MNYTLTDEEVIIVAPDPYTKSRVIEGLKAAANGADIHGIITGPDASEWTLITAAEWLYSEMSSTEPSPLRLNHLDNLILIEEVVVSPHTTSAVMRAWQMYDWTVTAIAARMFLADKPISEAALVDALTGHWHGSDVGFRLKALKSNLVTPRIVGIIACDNRLTLKRESAKHPMLTQEVGKHFISDHDAKTRANVIRQPWVPADSLYLLKDDPNTTVANAAKRALKKRNLAVTDEIDAVMEDEVSLFFLSATDDEDTLVRIAASANATEEAYRAVASQSDRAKMAVCQNRHVPSSLLEELSVSEAGLQNWHSPYDKALAQNPSNTWEGVEALRAANQWNREILYGAACHPDITPEAANEAARNYLMKVRVAAANTGLLTRETVESIMRYEARSGALYALLDNYADIMTDDEVREAYSRGGAKVQTKAQEVLDARGAALHPIPLDGEAPF